VSEGLPDPGGVASQAELRTMVERYVEELKTVGAFESVAVERALRRVERHRLLETFYYRTAGTGTCAADRRWRTTRSRSGPSTPKAIRRPQDGRSNGGSTDSC
jgi:hypothetical protein